MELIVLDLAQGSTATAPSTYIGQMGLRSQNIFCHFMIYHYPLERPSQIQMFWGLFIRKDEMVVLEVDLWWIFLLFIIHSLCWGCNTSFLSDKCWLLSQQLGRRAVMATSRLPASQPSKATSTKYYYFKQQGYIYDLLQVEWTAWV